MSKARSPREVCSTTMGTSALIGPRCARLGPRGPELAGARGLLLRGPGCPGCLSRRILAGRPQLCAGLRALGRDRDRALGHEVDRLAGGDLVAQACEAAAVAEALEQGGRRRVVALRRLGERLEQL